MGEVPCWRAKSSSDTPIRMRSMPCMLPCSYYANEMHAVHITPVTRTLPTDRLTLHIPPYPYALPKFGPMLVAASSTTRDRLNRVPPPTPIVLLLSPQLVRKRAACFPTLPPTCRETLSSGTMHILRCVLLHTGASGRSSHL
jgi:hypothetical protein